MEQIKGTVLNADGSLVKPPLPIPPDKTTLEAAIKKRDELNALNTELNRQYQVHVASGNLAAQKEVEIRQAPVASELTYYRDTYIPQLQKEYMAAYSFYESQITQYNKEFALWAAATAQINNTDPVVLQEQVKAEAAKTEGLLQIEKAKADSALELEKSKAQLALEALKSQTSALLSGSAESRKKLMIIGGVAVAIIIAATVLIYFYRKGKK